MKKIAENNNCVILQKNVADKTKKPAMNLTHQ
jgi:hypothetical protein